MARLTPHDITMMFLSLGILLAVARVLGELSQRLGQPAVVGEICAGILLGPTMLGKIAPDLASQLFPAEGNVAIVLHGMTTLAIALFLLVAGMEVELSTVWRRGKTAAAVSVAGVLVPFALGWLSASIDPFALGCEPDADPKIFTIFFATAVSISALPVIAKILMDLNLYRSDLGMITISAAVFDDLVGWLVFAVTLGMMGHGASEGNGVGLTITLTLLFAAFMLTLGRWLVHRIIPWLQAHTSWPGGVLGFAFAVALLSAALTEWIGIHAIFGSFLAGVAIGDSSRLRTETRRTILDFVSYLFAPLFFASVGLHVDFAVKFYPLIVGTVLIVACVGKILGCGLTARLTGMDWRTSWAIGFAMNARGAMEIILGLLAFQNGLIRQRMLVALVVMALVTSMMSGPAIQRLLKRPKSLKLSDYLTPRTFLGRLRATTARAAAVELAAPLESLGTLTRDQIAEIADSRSLTDARTDGKLAIIHASISGVSRVAAVAGVSASGIEFDSAASEPARLVFLVLASPATTAEALAIESHIQETFADPQALQEAIQSTTYTDFLAAFQARRTNESLRVTV